MQTNALVPRDAASIAAQFSPYNRLTVRQQKRWFEVLLSFEMKNSYEVFDPSGQAVFRVQEGGEGIKAFAARMFLGPARPFSASVSEKQGGNPLLELKRPFRFIYHRLEVRTPGGEMIGAIERKWSWVRRLYTIQGPQGQAVAELIGPFLKPWTFEIHTAGGGQVGRIQKRWSGIGKEMFTDADNFGIEFDNVPDPLLRTLAFAATVLIDVVHFERAKG